MYCSRGVVRIWGSRAVWLCMALWATLHEHLDGCGWSTTAGSINCYIIGWLSMLTKVTLNLMSLMNISTIEDCLYCLYQASKQATKPPSHQASKQASKQCSFYNTGWVYDSYIADAGLQHYGLAILLHSNPWYLATRYPYHCSICKSIWKYRKHHFQYKMANVLYDICYCKQLCHQEWKWETFS